MSEQRKISPQCNSAKKQRGRQSRENTEQKVVAVIESEADSGKLKSDYEHRHLDFCHFCGLKYNVGNRIPRIIVGCGHTFCTSCLGYFLRNQRIRCPICRKLLKGVDTVDKLPLNFNILYEVVTKDKLLANVNFEKCLQADLDAEEEDAEFNLKVAPYLCQAHDQRIKHFYCSEHPSIFCRECIKDLHHMDECFVVDLYEIEKMRVLQEKNQLANGSQLAKRTDGATDSYVEHPKALDALNSKELLTLLYQTGPIVQKEPLQKALFGEDSKGLKRAPARESDLNRKKQPANVGALDLGSSYGDEVAEDHEHGEQRRELAHDLDNEEYGSSEDIEDFPEDEELLKEGELNEAQKRRLKADLMLIGYEDEDEDFEEALQQTGMPSEKQVLAAQLAAGAGGEEEDFQMSKKMFAAQMRAELLGQPVPQTANNNFVDDDDDEDYEDYEDESGQSYDVEQAKDQKVKADFIKYQQQEDAEQESDEAQEIKAGAGGVDEDSI